MEFDQTLSSRYPYPPLVSFMKNPTVKNKLSRFTNCFDDGDLLFFIYPWRLAVLHLISACLCKRTCSVCHYWHRICYLRTCRNTKVPIVEFLTCKDSNLFFDLSCNPCLKPLICYCPFLITKQLFLIRLDIKQYCPSMHSHLSHGNHHFDMNCMIYLLGWTCQTESIVDQLQWWITKLHIYVQTN